MYTALLASLLLRCAVATVTDNDTPARTLDWAYDPGDYHDFALSFTIRDPTQMINDIDFHKVVVDTGSVGLLAGACALGYKNASQLANLSQYPPAHEVLSSSGVYYKGNWVPKDVILRSTNGSSLTSRIPILVVKETGKCWNISDCDNTKITCHPMTCLKNGSVPSDSPEYLGVGFARLLPDQTEPTAKKNLLLNMDLSAFGKIHQGYRIAKGGLVVGVLDSDFDEGYHTLDLTPNMTVDGVTDWNPIESCVRVAGGKCVNGTILFDTGIDYSFLAVNKTEINGHTVECPAEYGGQCLKHNTDVSISIGPIDNIIAHYSYQVTNFTGTPKLTPNQTLWEGHDHAGCSFVNTGRRFFNGYNLTFDSEAGIVGLKWTGGHAEIPSQGYDMDQHPLWKTGL